MSNVKPASKLPLEWLTSVGAVQSRLPHVYHFFYTKSHRLSHSFLNSLFTHIILLSGQALINKYFRVLYLEFNHSPKFNNIYIYLKYLA